MYTKVPFLAETDLDKIIRLDNPHLKITPQPEPTSPRIKELLSKGLMVPEGLTPSEVRELCASVVYHLIRQKRAS